MAYDSNPAATHNPATGGTPTAAWGDILNANFAELGAAWTAFTPAMTFSGGGSLTIGNGTIAGAYRQIGKTLDVNISLVVGSTTSFGTNDWRFTLPNSLTSAARRQCGSAFGNDVGTAFRTGVAWVEPSTTYIAIVSHGAATAWSTTAPHTWANTDQLAISATIEVA